MDTGINGDHLEFVDKESNSQVICGFDAFAFVGSESEATSCDDGNGHGTYIAGIIGGTNYVSCHDKLHERQISAHTVLQGVAKDADIISVKVFDNEGTGSIGSVLAGIDFVHDLLKISEGSTNIVVNMSFGSHHKLRSFHIAVRGLVDTGVVVTASAGNDHSKACNKSPAYMNEVLTAAASTYDDSFAPYSNYGDCIDIVAPGDKVTGPWPTSIGSFATISGTSAAAAHVTGVVALIWEASPSLNEELIGEQILLMAESEVIVGLPEDQFTLNLFLNMARLDMLVK